MITASGSAFDAQLRKTNAEGTEYSWFAMLLPTDSLGLAPQEILLLRCASVSELDSLNGTEDRHESPSPRRQLTYLLSYLL